MNLLQGLLFDLDGTLMDSRQAVVEAVLKTAEYFAPGKCCMADIKARFGETWDSFASFLGCTDKETITKTYTQFIKDNYENSIAPFPGITENLILLREAGYKLAIVTNNLRHLTLRGLRLNEIESLFDVIVTIDDVENGKPHPEPVEMAYRKLKMNKREVMMIGDSMYDVRAAYAAGVECAVIDWYKSYNKSQWLPDYYFYNIDELMEMLTYSQKRKAV